MATETWRSGMKQMPPNEPIADPDIAIFNALSKKNALQNFDPIQKLIETEQVLAQAKAIEGKAPRNAEEAAKFAAIKEAAEMLILNQGRY